MAKTPAERQKQFRADRAKELETLTAQVAALAGQVAGLDRRLRDVEDRHLVETGQRWPDPTIPTFMGRPVLNDVKMNPAMLALVNKQPPKHVTPDGEIRRTFQGRPVRTCCESIEGMAHTDLCAEVS